MGLTFKEIKEVKNKYGNNIRLKPKKVSKLSKCEYCGNLYIKTHHMQKFCSEYCYHSHRLEYQRNWKKEHNKFKTLKKKIEAKCEYCGKPYIKTHHSQKFCSEKCYKYHRLDYQREWDHYNRHYKRKLGTSGILGTPNPDFEKELEIIKKEKKRLGL